MKKLLTFISTIILGLTLTSCSNGSKQTIVFGTMAQPGEPLIEYIKDDFEALIYTSSGFFSLILISILEPTLGI